MKFRFIILSVLILFISAAAIVMADEYDDISKQLNDLKNSLNSSQKATATNEKELKQLNDKLNVIKQKVSYLESEIAKKAKEVKRGEEALVYQKKLLDERAVSYYKNLKNSSVDVVELLVSENIAESLQQFFYQKSVQEEDRKAITKIVMYIKDLEEKKKTLESEQVKLTAIKQEVDKQSQFLAGEVAKSKKYESELTSKIAALSQRQQEIVAQKQSTLNLPKSAGYAARGCSDDRGVDPGFSPRFAFFTYGAPHRNGLNQYGAKGRADANKSYTDILNAYYTDFQLSDYDSNTSIIVNGTNEYGQTFSDESMSLEEYAKHLYEMPPDWPMEALKAQAVAARTYGLRIMKVHGKVQPNQNHQVVKKETNSQRWVDAVEQTKGKVMLRGGEPFLAEYASTHGGYVLNLGRFDGSGGNPSNFSDLNDRAYDKSSPWFYCDWGARSQYSNTAWLKSSELADIVNIILLVKRDSGASSHLYQTDKPNPAGTDTWDAERVKTELRNRGTSSFSNITSVSMSTDFGSGKTSSVTFSGDGGSVNFSASEFKDWFNLRAPANIQIVGPLYNVEQK